MVKSIQCLKDFKDIEGKLPSDFTEYLKCEFYGLYEYLRVGEGQDTEDFIL